MSAEPKIVESGRSRSRLAILLGVGLSSAGVLVLEIVLTRVFAVTQFYHFAFVAVSLALLGFGASGSVLTAFPSLGRGGPRRWALLAAAQAVTTIGAYALTNALQFDSYAIAWESRQVLYLVIYYLALAVPFFFGGAVVGVLLSGWDQPSPVPSHHVYGASLVGAGVGCVVALAGLPFLGGVGVVAVGALLPGLAALSFSRSDPDPHRPALLATTGLLIALTVVAVRPPGLLDLRLSPYKDLSAVLRVPEAVTVASGWTVGTRVDHVRSPSIRSLPGLSLTFQGQVPAQDGLTFDGDDLSPVPQETPAKADYASYLLGSLPFALRPGGDALILESRGGLDVLVALAAGAGSVVAVEPNELAGRYATSSNGAYQDSRVALVTEEPRSFVERTPKRFDVIDVALTSPYRPVTSGAYSLAEDYRLTVEAFERFLARLKPNGLVMTVRWLQVPPSEAIRLVAVAAEAARAGGSNPVESVVALRGYSTALVMVKPDGFTSDELGSIRDFAQERRFDLVAMPGLAADESNRFNVLPTDDYHSLATEILSASDPGAIFEAYDFDISPPTDDQPFFGHSFRWAQASDVVAALGRTWQPFGGAGYFVLLALLGLALAAAAVLILGPLAIRARRGRTPRPLVTWTVAYFGLLGIGFLFVEIPIFQRYILLLGRPTTALGVVLFSILVSSGIGSRLSDRVPWRFGAVSLTGTLVAYPWLLSWLAGVLLPLSLGVRMVVGGLALAPLGFLMGTMFPKGLAYLEEVSEGLVPWAWGINGATSVVSAAAAALLALSFGFTIVTVLGAVCYAICAMLVRPPRTLPG